MGTGKNKMRMRVNEKFYMGGSAAPSGDANLLGFADDHL
jgi:hypothetical protein